MQRMPFVLRVIGGILAFLGLMNIGAFFLVPEGAQMDTSAADIAWNVGTSAVLVVTEIDESVNQHHAAMMIVELRLPVYLDFLHLERVLTVRHDLQKSGGGHGLAVRRGVWQVTRHDFRR